MAVQQKQCFLKNINDAQKSILLNNDKLKIGRGRDMSVCLLSVMISKYHATINRVDEKWTITDENSMNGVLVNQKQLDPLVPCPINEGDVIQIGKSKDQPFSYTFQSRIVTKHKEGKLKPQKNLATCDKLPITSTDNYSKMSPSKHKVLLSNTTSSSAPSSSAGCSSSKPDLNLDYVITSGTSKRKRNSPKSPLCQAKQQNLLKYEKKLQEMEKRLKASEQALQQEKEFSSNQTHVINNLSLEMEGAKKELEEVQSEIVFQEKENLLWKTIEEERATLELEMDTMELRMKDVANQAELEDLLASKRLLEQILSNKDAEQKLLQKQLEEAKEASEKEKESALKIKEDVLSNFAELMETELQCSICNELFVQATTLSCAHSFCAFCIGEWLKRKNNCPVCRTPVTAQAHALVLDSYIEKMVSCFSDEMKERRVLIIKERKVAESSVPKNEKQWLSSHLFSHLNADIHLPSMWSHLANQDAVWSELQSENESLSDDSDESFVDGHSDAYFGGYGRCYFCGQQGHWATGCPFR